MQLKQTRYESHCRPNLRVPVLLNVCYVYKRPLGGRALPALKPPAPSLILTPNPILTMKIIASLAALFFLSAVASVEEKRDTDVSYMR